MSGEGAAGLEPGERIIAEIRPSAMRAVPGLWVFLAIFVAVGVVMMALRGAFSPSDWAALLVRSIIVSVIWLVIGWLMLRRNHWIISDRRLIDAGRGKAAALADVASAQPTLFGGNVAVRLRDGRRLFIQAVPRAKDFAAQIIAARDAALPEGGRADV
ncbi:MAG: hypothetical protein Q4F71_09010 [Paracoccus sp. (in: a-proteobacteria)]|nr:hypothetical protein [Paracoccus sp. (in: a-proteobacteria)]